MPLKGKRSEGERATAMTALLTPAAAYCLHPHGSYLFPPIGAVGVFIIPMVYALSHTVRQFVWMTLKRKGCQRTIVIAAAIAFVVLYLYVQAALTYIKPVPFVGQHRIIYVSVGIVRTEFARQHYAGVDDVKMLSKRGVHDGAIYELWTSDSINRGRLKLFTYYTIMIAAFASLSGASKRLRQLSTSD